MADKLLSRTKTAIELDVHPRTVVNLVKRGLLRETRLPSALGHRTLPRYSEAAIRAYRDSGYTKK